MGIEGLLAGYTLCDRYRVDSVLGRGGMGIVYRAFDTRLDRAVAVKVITSVGAETAGRARLRDRFHREARAIARIQHPNVVSVFDFGTDPRLDLDFLVMELLRGHDLGVRLSRTARLPVRLSGEILIQAARGLSAGHDSGIVHRDVKPGNLFLADVGDGRVRVALLDFGIVQLAALADEGGTATHLTLFGRTPHSPAYAAPEQLRGAMCLTAACDVWGLAVTAFQMMTGEKPFRDDDRARILQGALLDPPSARKRNPAVPRALDEAIRTALATDPDDRFHDARAFARALEHALRESGYAPAEDPPLAPLPAPAAATTAEDATLLDPSADAGDAPFARWRSPFHHPAPDSLAAVESTLAAPLPLGRVEAAPMATATEAVLPPVVAAADRLTTGPGRFRRACAAAWSLLVTLGSVGLASGFGYGFYVAHADGHVEPFYAAMAGLTIALPWSIHRILGRRGSLLLALLGSVLVAVGVFRFAVPLTGPDTSVLALPIAQLVTCAWLLRLTRREPEPAPALPDSASV